MALRDWIIDFGQVATATVATTATPTDTEQRTVAIVATVIVADKEKTGKPTTEKSSPKAVKRTKPYKRQINCQAYEYNGVLMSTKTEHCLEWQGPYCKGCVLVNTHGGHAELNR